jgi:hypothetical protein
MTFIAYGSFLTLSEPLPLPQDSNAITIQDGRVLKSMVFIDPNLPVCSILLDRSPQHRVIKAGTTFSLNQAYVDGSYGRGVRIGIMGIKGVNQFLCALRGKVLAEDNWASATSALPSIKDFETILGDLFETKFNTDPEVVSSDN